MTLPERANDWNPDVARVSQELADRLRTRGIEVLESDSPDDVFRLVEAVEEFEAVVEARGGDLMVDEPPTSGRAQPDDADFLLPTRAADETIAAYTKRLQVATAAARTHERRG
jgi:hypothetical protein